MSECPQDKKDCLVNHAETIYVHPDLTIEELAAKVRKLEIQLCDKELKTLNLEHPLVKRNLALEMALKNILDNRHDDDKFWAAIEKAKKVSEGK